MRKGLKERSRGGESSLTTLFGLNLFLFFFFWEKHQILKVMLHVHIYWRGGSGVAESLKHIFFDKEYDLMSQ